MTSLMQDAVTVDVADALDEAARYNHWAKSSRQEHRRGLYRKKDQLLLEAMSAAPEQFFVDSITGSPPVMGISHNRSGRRFHIPVKGISSEMRSVLQKLRRGIDPGGGGGQ